MPGYYGAAVCSRGHLHTAMLELTVRAGAAPAPRCSICGAEVLTECPGCGAPIRGAPTDALLHPTGPPDFCDECGAPFRWASRRARLYALENLLEPDDVSEADRLTLREQFDILRQPDLDDDEQVRRWLVVAEIAPALLDSGRGIFATVASRTVQEALGR